MAAELRNSKADGGDRTDATSPSAGPEDPAGGGGPSFPEQSERLFGILARPEVGFHLAVEDRSLSSRHATPDHAPGYGIVAALQGPPDFAAGLQTQANCVRGAGGDPAAGGAGVPDVARGGQEIPVRLECLSRLRPA